MSSDRRPAKVRVVSSGQAQAGLAGAAAGTPARRRTDEPQQTQGSAVQAQAVSATAPAKEGASLLWIAGALVLFIVGCAAGGALFALSGFTSAGPL